MAEAFGIEAGDAPAVDLEAERRHGEFLRANRRLVRAAADLSDGGLALAAFELAEAAGTGLTLDAGDLPTLFGEDQARYLVAVAPGDLATLQAAGAAAGVPVDAVGRFGGTTVDLGGETAPLADLSRLYRTAFAKAVG
jgi:phosphoribosylformylglycinamidine synthase